MTRRVYIVGPHIPNGGTLMAYHLGLIVAEHIGGEPIGVRPSSEPAAPLQFSYPRSIDVIDLDRLLNEATSNDVLVMNPSFSPLWLGPRFPGFKLMYVQDFRTFEILDRWFDSYVSVSSFVCGFLQYVYQLKSPIIYPFIDVSEITEVPHWVDRPADRVLVFKKGDDVQQNIILAKVKELVRQEREEVIFDEAPRGLMRVDFLNRLASYRYVLSLCCAEGFGLVPLESMALGATLTAFDAGGGSSYMRDDENCWCTKYPDVARLAERLLFALSNPDAAQRLTANGKRRGREFGYERFRSQWIEHLRRVLP